MANYSGGFSDTPDNLKDFSQKYSVSDPGPYIGIIKDTVDPMRMGRLGVVIPALSNTDAKNPHISELIWCQYLSPFYGAKSFKSVSSTDPYSFQQGQTAYGMWAVPPDIDTNVLVIFAQGEKSKKNAFWLGCIQEPLTNHMVPGLASSTNSKMDLRGGESGSVVTSHDMRQSNYGTDFLPVIEKNKKKYNPGEGIGALGQWKLPINEDLTYQLMRQGLIKDPVRGTTTSSARRETPSQVFGISTPGRFKSDTRTPNIGLAGTPVKVDRFPGHSFVMDDGDINGRNQLTRLRTASGHQLLMHDTEGVIYIANASGNAWIEMNAEGRIDIYSGAGGMNIRTEGDFNLHSNANINMSAGAGIRMAATGLDEVLYTKDDTAVKKGQKAVGDVAREEIPGSIIQSADFVFNVGEKAIFNTSKDGPIQSYARSSITSYSGGMQLHGASGGWQIAGGKIHLNSTKPAKEWGGMKQDGGLYDKEGLNIAPTYEGDVELIRKYDLEPLSAFSRKTKTKTIVHRLVTHEPMLRFQPIATLGMLPPISLQGLYAEAEILGPRLPSQGGMHSDAVGGGGGGGGDAYKNIFDTGAVSQTPGLVPSGSTSVNEYAAPSLAKDFDGQMDAYSKVQELQEFAKKFTGQVFKADEYVDLHNYMTKKLKYTVDSREARLKAMDLKKLTEKYKTNFEKWNRLKNTPGTRESIEDLNRHNPHAPVRYLQAKADADRYIKDVMPNSSDVKKATNLVNNYFKAYDGTFKVAPVFDSIGNSLASLQVDIANPHKMFDDFKSSVTNEVVETFTQFGSGIIKQIPYVDQAMKLYGIGGEYIDMGLKVISDLKNFKENAPMMLKNYAISTVNSHLTNAISGELSKIISPAGFLKGKILGNNMGAVSQIGKHILGSNTINIGQMSSIWAGKHTLASEGLPFLTRGGGATIGGSFAASIGSFGKNAISSVFKPSVAAGPWTMFSDIRLKEEIQLIGRSQSGINIYRFKYKDTDGMYEGVMAQEVPWAAEIGNDGYYMVDYNKVDVEFRRLN